MDWVGVAVWVGVVGLIAASIRSLRLHRVLAAPEGESPASLSIVVPARNEAPRVGALIRSLRLQDHPDFEVIVVDDRSSDGTGEVARRAAEGDGRIFVIRVEERPSGWQGKLHAIAAGAESARGEWLLFLDADQRLASTDALRRLVFELERRRVGAVSLIARNVQRHWWDRWWIGPIVNNPLVWGVILLIQRLRPASPWLIGSIALRSSTYRDLGGADAAVRCAAGAYDDWGWARSLAERNQRAAMIYLPELEDATNFESFREVVRGLARWLAGIFSYRKGGWLAATAIAAALLFLTGVAVVALAQASLGRVPDMGLLALAAVVPTVGVAYCRWNREPVLFALSFHLVAVLAVAAIGLAMWARLRNRVVWRDEPMQIVAPPPGTSEHPVHRARPPVSPNRVPKDATSALNA